MSLSRAAIGAVDQAVLSAGSLVISAVLVRFATKEEFGAYNLYVAAILLALSVQNALVLSPMLTLVPKLERDGMARFLHACGPIARRLTIVLVPCCLLGLKLYEEFVPTAGLTWTAGGVFALALVAALGREYARTHRFALGDMWGALGGDAAFTAVVVTSVAVCATVLPMNSAAALGSMALGGGVLLLKRRWASREVASDVEEPVWPKLWEAGRWALPSVVASWVYANSYVFFVAAVHGNGMVGELAAARLLTVPLNFLTAGWANYLRPKASALVARGQGAEMLRVARRGAAILVAGACIYLALLVVAYPLLAPFFANRGYVEVLPLALAWGAYFLVVSVRGVGMACVLSELEGFRTMFGYTVSALLVVLPCLLLLGRISSAVFVPAVLTLAELVFAALVWRKALSVARAAGTS